MVSDAHKGIVRILADAMKQLGLSSGDAVEVEGKRCTLARVLPAFSDSCSVGSIQMDGILRQNAGVGIGEEVTIRPTVWERARSVVLAPAVAGWIPTDDLEIAHFKQKLIGLPVRVEDIVALPTFAGNEENFVVEGVLPKGNVIIGKDTAVYFKGSEGSEKLSMSVRYEDVGGLSKEVQKIREIVELPLKYPRLFRVLGVDAPKGILLYGPPGTGKTLIARAVANETQTHFIHVDGPEIMHKYYGESEARLRQVFDEARKKAPSIIFLDEVDAIAPRRTEVHGDVEKRVVAQLLALMDGLESRGNVVVLAATNVPDLVDPALRRPGRFDREICINVPDQPGRLEILRIHTRGMNLAKDVSLEHLAAVTHGFVGADLAALCREAGMYALRRVLADYRFGSDDPEGLYLEVTAQDFLDALTDVEPSATREFSMELPTVNWDNVGGLKEIKEKLEALVEWPFNYPHLYQHYKLQAPKGILLSGPPGTGKTLLAKALAKKSKLNFLPVDTPLLFSHWMGETEKALHEVFKKARQASPCILFFDEIDALAPKRQGGEKAVTARLVSQFLMELDGLEELKEVVVLAATNRIDMIDPALLRPGRFDVVLEFPLPDLNDRLQILRVHLKDRPLGSDVKLAEIAAATEGMTGSDLQAIADRAAFISMAEVVRSRQVDDNGQWCIEQKHLVQAMEELYSRHHQPLIQLVNKQN
ncbi:MAG TPA: CDC48 family AAA ATPase [Syntrophomonadaceae bacterium]|nr:CDC48 family AAA ATPase [Syntrophomonadaceae bacterium]